MTLAMHAFRPSFHSVGAAFAGLLVAGGAAAEGLRPPPGLDMPWSRWQARVLVDAAEAPRWAADGPRDGGGLAARGLSVMGDYVFARSIGDNGQAHALRATSGVVFGQRSALWLGAPGQSTQGGFAIDRRSSVGIGNAWSAQEGGGSLPYIGLGYSALNRHGWNFSADFGLLAMGATSPVRLGRALSTQGADELLREMRLSPVLQVGASYAF